VERPYHSNSQKNIAVADKNDTEALARFLTRNGQALLPMVELIEESKLAVDELIDVLGRASVEAVLRLSAEEAAGCYCSSNYSKRSPAASQPLPR